MHPAAHPRLVVLSLAFAILGAAAAAEAAAPKADQALQLMPIQKDVDFDRPSPADLPACKIAAQRLGNSVGWVVQGPDGIVLRQFVDTNGDNVVDQWSYFKDGLEVYRDIDGDFNGKADQCRWFHTGGSRWGLDKNEDGKLDAWKSISAEEVTAEVVAALARRDADQFARVALSETELKSLGLGAAKEKELAGKLAGLGSKFEQLASRQREVTAATQWVQFSGSRPGVVPAGTDGSTRDIRVYENVVAVVRTGDEHGQVQIGTLVQVGDGWRVIDLPQPLTGGQDQLATTGFFFASSGEGQTPMASAGPSEKTQELLAQLEKLDAAAEQAASPEQLARLHSQRADVVEQIAGQSASAEDRAMWLRQLADMISAAVQAGEYPQGVNRLEALLKRIQQEGDDKQILSYVRFRQLMADYGLGIQSASTDQFVKLHAEWLKQLEQFVAEYPESADAAEAMLQLAIDKEYAGEEAEAKKWYDQVASRFPTSPQAKKAAGALRRLESVGKPITLQGKSPAGGLVDLAAQRGKVVLIQYWATWCEPCKADMATLKELWTKYGPSGFSIIGVNLDASREAMAAYLAETRLPWPQIYEEGGLDSRPANEMGILTLPTMILIDQEGKVVSRSVQVAELERELKRLVR